MYAQDNEAYPISSYRVGGVEYRWHAVIQPYLNSTPVLVCPSTGWQFDFRNMSYGYNYQYLGNSRALSAGGTGSVSEAAIEYPADTLAIADSDGTGGWYANPLPWSLTGRECERLGNHGYLLDPPSLPVRPGNVPSQSACSGVGLLPQAPGPGFGRVAARHRGGANVAFCDGHAKWLRREVLERDNTFWNGRRSPEP
jgi:prepilin-type processing-associated H-X9-DG protein